jgi:uncharacterized protein with NRDE domain
LVIAANRDEFYARAAAPASWIEPDLLAGRDLDTGGTWLALRRNGRFALLTNYRDPRRHDPAAPTRGTLPLRILHDARPLAATVHDIASDLDRFNGCNLLAGEADRMLYVSNRAPGVREVAPGVHGLSNHLLDTTWPKVEHSKARLAAWLASGSDDMAPVFDLLADRALARDDDLPQTGVPLEWERLLSAPFIHSPGYGTRCSTVVLITRNDHARFVERSFDAGGQLTGEAVFEFDLAARA